MIPAALGEAFDGPHRACPTAETGVTQDRVGVPSRWTVQAPQSACPQPNLVPVSPMMSRSTQSRGICGRDVDVVDGAVDGKAHARYPEGDDQ